jgi:hypothetical protein
MSMWSSGIFGSVLYFQECQLLWTWWTICVCYTCLVSPSPNLDSNSEYETRMKSSIVWDITLCSPLKVNRRFEGTCHLHMQDRRRNQQEADKHIPPICFMLTSCLLYCFTMKMELKCFSETSPDFQRITQFCIPEDRTLHSDRCENVRSYEAGTFGWMICYILEWGFPITTMLC